MIDTLLGYVADANVQVMVSYAVTESNFQSPGDYAKVQQALTKGTFIGSEFDGNKRIAKFILNSGQVIETKFLGHGHLRNVVKLGHRDNGQPSIFLEKDYFQTHRYLDYMRDQHQILLKETAADANTGINGTINIVGSRSVGGVYSDAAQAAQLKDYRVQIPERTN